MTNKNFNILKSGMFAWLETGARCKQGFSRVIMLVVLICGLCVLSSCTSDNDDHPVPPGYHGVPLVIFDTDIGSSTDDLFALEMLHHYQDEGRCKLLGVMANRIGEDYAALADLMNTYYGHGNDRYQKPGTKVWCDAMLEKIRKYARIS